MQLLRPRRAGSRAGAGRRRPGAVAAAALLAVVAAGCGAGDGTGPASPEGADDGADDPGTEQQQEPDAATPPDGEGPAVVATTSILADVVDALLGEQGEVTTLVPAGVDPHGYEPSAADAARLRESQLVVANGLGLEESLRAVLDALDGEGVAVLEVAPALDPLPFDDRTPDDDHGDDDHGDDDHDDAADEGTHEDDDGHGHGELDPHVWFDPVRMADAVDLIADALVEHVDDLDEQRLRADAEAYRAELLEVHDELEAAFAEVPRERRRVVTNHEALGYLAARYDLEVIATVVPGSGTADTDARAFAELVETVERADVDVVFAENTDSTELAEQLASEVGGRGEVDIEVVRVYTDALGEPGSGADSYLGLLRTTGRLVADALA